MLTNLIPYPAEIIRNQSGWSGRLLDFNNSMVFEGADKESVISSMESELLRLIIYSLKDGHKTPKPDQYLETINEKNLYMIDPLNNTQAQQNQGIQQH